MRSSSAWSMPKGVQGSDVFLGQTTELNEFHAMLGEENFEKKPLNSGIGKIRYCDPCLQIISHLIQLHLDEVLYVVVEFPLKHSEALFQMSIFTSPRSLGTHVGSPAGSLPIFFRPRSLKKKCERGGRESLHRDPQCRVWGISLRSLQKTTINHSTVFLDWHFNLFVIPQVSQGEI